MTPKWFEGNSHPDSPWFPLRREYRISRCRTRVNDRDLFRVEFKTWITGRWKVCSGCYDTLHAAQSELRYIKYGLPGWVPVE